MNMKGLWGLPALVILVCGASHAHAAMPLGSGMMDVSSSIDYECSVNLTPMAFGYYTGEELDSEASINVTCNIPVSYSIHMGSGRSGNEGDRRMVRENFPTDTLQYQLYTADRRFPTDIWRVGNIPPVTAPSNASTHPVYGRIFGPQEHKVGRYTDTVQVTVMFEMLQDN